MNIENHVCTLDQARAFEKLGIKQKHPFFVWMEVAKLNNGDKTGEWVQALFRPNSGYVEYVAVSPLPDECIHNNEEHEVETRDNYPALTAGEMLALIPARWSLQAMNSKDYALFNHNSILYPATAAPSPGEALGKSVLTLLEMHYMSVDQVNEKLNS